MKYVMDRPDLGRSPEHGFDCSGFVGFVLSAAGLHIPDFIGQDDSRRPIRHSNEFWDHYGVAVHQQYISGGDLIFFSRNSWHPTHIGIVRDEETYIHSPGQDGAKVCIAPIETKQIARPESVPGRALYAVNPIGFKSPVVISSVVNYRFHQQPI
jgi:cell wall-associated NlpC family hydrolase